MNKSQVDNLRTAEELFVAAYKYEERRKLPEAFRCLYKAATLGHSSSQLNLGNFYAAGKGVRKDLAKAAYWYRSAYKLGNETAARNLAIDFLSAGKLRSAIRWFEKGVKKKMADRLSL
jgi:TPR repeat protein